MRGAGRGTPRHLQEERPERRPPRYVARLPTCERKFAYKDVAEADAAALLFSAADRVGLEAYRCPRCGLIHLGHTRKG